MSLPARSVHWRADAGRTAHFSRARRDGLLNQAARQCGAGMLHRIECGKCGIRRSADETRAGPGEPEKVRKAFRNILLAPVQERR